MVEKEVTITTSRNFCDVCDVMETYPQFRRCSICGKLLCPKCENIINPLNYQPLGVCSDCVSPELEEIKKIGHEVEKLYGQIEELHKKEIEIVENIRKKRSN